MGSTGWTTHYVRQLTVVSPTSWSNNRCVISEDKNITFGLKAKPATPAKY